MATFKARARTVDLLGRQQIAGIPTAFSELFKNAHDAYAKRVEVDYFRSTGLLVLRDDGNGMSRTDFVERWLTLGTDSKVGAERGLDQPPVQPMPEKLVRPILGAKGIGRLAVAAIGPQVLILTRAKGADGQLSDLTMALINWRVFELPGINLDEVEIPIASFAGGTMPTREDLTTAASALRRNLEGFDLDDEELAPILKDLSVLNFDPGMALDKLGSPRLDHKGHGTHFLVQPTSDQLAADIDIAPAREAALLQQTLIGFGNTMLPNSSKPRIKTAFRDRHPGKAPRDLIAPAEFFTPDDFRTADHRVHGSFDEKGDFRGSVQVYGGKVQPYDFIWTGGGRRPLEAGGFGFDLAYVQGDARDSSLDTSAHATVKAKLDRIGGLYVYRDDIRVLPYGTPGYDFLAIERRRTENIGRAFFSYRRMFGVISLATGTNDKLEEKAGREGFVSNRAYREFRAVLQAFFVDLAAEFFVKEGPRADQFERGRNAAQARHAALKAQRERTDRERKTFEKKLQRLTGEIQRNEPERCADRALAELHDALKSLDRSKPTRERDRIAEARSAFATDLDRYRSAYRITAPADLGLTVELRRDWTWLEDHLSTLDEKVWLPAERAAAIAVRSATDSLPDAPGRQEVMDAVAKRASAGAAAVLEDARKGLRDRARSADDKVAALIRDATDQLATSLRRAVDEAKADLSSQSEEVVLSRQLELQKTARDVGEQVAMMLDDAGRQLSNWARSGPARGLEAAAVEEEMLQLRERADRDLELAQLGLVTQVLSHEMDETIVAIRSGLDRLNAYADVNPQLGSVRDELRTGFDHLDTYLSLFTPLQRRLNRRKAVVTGREIANFVSALFEHRLAVDEIQLRVTDDFAAYSVRAYRSTIYPVFVNLVDNACYWTRQARPPRWIELSTAGARGLAVSDSGPGISPRDLDAIWQFGFTRKPDGRGAGLYISRQVLGRDDWDLSVTGQADNTSFVLLPPKDEVVR